MPERAVSPVFVLVTDGHHTDDFDAGLEALLARPWGRDAVRSAITIGRDVNVAALQKFIGDESVLPVQASNPEQLIQQIRWLSRSRLEGVSQIDGSGHLRSTGSLGADAETEW